MQNVVVSCVWVVGLCQVVIPVISFSRDTQPHCKHTNLPETLLFLTFSIFAFLCCLLGPTFFDKIDLFHFYKFPTSFTYYLDAIVWAFLLVFLVVLPISRKYLDCWEQWRESRAIMPVSNSQ